MVAELVIMPQTQGWSPGFTAYQSSGFAPLSSMMSIATMVIGLVVALYCVVYAESRVVPAVQAVFLIVQMVVSTVDKAYAGMLFAVILKFVLVRGQFHHS